MIHLGAYMPAGAVVLGLMAPAFARDGVAGQTVIDLETRPAVTTRYLALAPARPKAAVLLFTGGQGIANIPDNPGPGWARNGNFLVRTRELFRSRDLFVAVIDVPSDHRGGYFAFRATAEHAEDVAAVIASIRQRASGVPVWLVGTSRGTISAASVAARLPQGKGADGVVLTASLTRPGGQKAPPGGAQTVFDFDLGSVTMPALVVHHREDTCFATPFLDAEPLRAKFTRASRTGLLAFSGGSPRESHECEPQAPHGFFGIEREVVDAIADWILKIN